LDLFLIPSLSTTVYGADNSTSTWLAGLRPDSFPGATLGVQIAQAAKSIDSNILSPAATDGSSGSLDPNIPGYKSFTTEDMVKEAHKSGMLVKPWTVSFLYLGVCIRANRLIGQPTEHRGADLRMGS
jgi:hypothetical protein